MCSYMYLGSIGLHFNQTFKNDFSTQSVLVPCRTARHQCCQAGSSQIRNKSNLLLHWIHHQAISTTPKLSRLNIFGIFFIETQQISFWGFGSWSSITRVKVYSWLSYYRLLSMLMESQANDSQLMRQRRK